MRFIAANLSLTQEETRARPLLNGLLAQSIDILAALTLAQLLRQIQILLPDVGGQDALAFCVGAAGLPAGAVPAVLRADKAVLSFVIGKLPGLVNVFLSFVPGIGNQGDLAVTCCTTREGRRRLPPPLFPAFRAPGGDR